MDWLKLGWLKDGWLKGIIGGRGVITSAFAVLAAAAIALSISGRGCADDDPAPLAAAKRFAAAVLQKDRQVVFAMLSESTRRQLTRDAKHARDLVGAEGNVEAYDLVRIDQLASQSVPIEFRLVEHKDNYARIEAVVRHGNDSVLHLVRENGVWKIDLLR